MAYNQVRVGGQSGEVYKLPEGVSFETFNWDRTQAILQEGIGGPFKNGAAVVDSLDIRVLPEGQTPVEAIRNLLVRNGAEKVLPNPNGAVA